MYKNLDHISNILWHFVGKDPDLALNYLELKLANGRVSLQPFTEDREFHERHILVSEPRFSDREDPEDRKAPTILKVREPRAMCFCDISVHNLPSHMNKYGNVGIGIRKSVVIDKELFKPVLYYPLKHPRELMENKEGFWNYDRDERISILNDFLKIPTAFEGQKRSEERKTETFKEIYEEREWRGFQKVVVLFEDIAFFVLPNRNSLRNRNPMLRQVISEASVGLIFADDIFESEE